MSLSAERACKGRWRSTYPWRQLYFKTVADASNRDGGRGDEEEWVALSRAVMAFRHGVLGEKERGTGS
jgi:hypothetical protein